MFESVVGAQNFVPLPTKHMPEIEPTIQEQNFMPVKRPNAWHRFLMWLHILTPKHKLTLGLILFLVLGAIAGVIYFSLAADEFTLSMDGLNNDSQVTVGRTNLELDINFDTHPTLEEKPNYIKVVLGYDSTVIDKDSIKLDSSSLDPVLAEIKNVNFEKTDNQITIEARCDAADGECVQDLNSSNFFYLPKGIIKGSLARIIYDILPTAPVSQKVLEIIFVSNEVASRISYSAITLLPVKTLEPWRFTVIQRVGGGSLSLNPNKLDTNVGKSFDVDLMLNADSNDVVAVSTDIKYDPNLLSLKVLSSTSFQVVGVENKDIANGTYNLVRGTFGNGVDGDGTKTPEENGKGASGLVTVATLRFTALNNATAAQVSLNNITAVKDDGAGGSLTFPVASANYTIETKEDFKADLTISNLQIKPVPISDNKWNVEVAWETNKESNTMLNGNVVNSDLTLIHSVTIDNLPAENYLDNYTIRSQINSTNGNWAEQKLTFTLGALSDTLIIKNLTAKANYNSANISWNTEGGKNYGEADGAIISCNPDDIEGDYRDFKESNLTLSHSFQINGFLSGTNYTCQVQSDDKKGGVAKDTVNFTTKKGLGFDANVVLKVEPDRICDKWLYCRSEVQIVNTKNQTENLCFDLGVCDEKDSKGNCVASAGLANAVAGSEQIYNHPAMVNAVENLSGLAKVGLNWGKDATGKDKIVNGYYNYASMTPKGQDIYIANSDFESGSAWPWKASNKNSVLAMANKYDSNVLVMQPQNNGSDWASAETALGNISSGAGYIYAISMGIWTSGEPRDAYIQLKIGNKPYRTLKIVPVSNYPQTVVLLSNQRGSEFTSADGAGAGSLIVGVNKGVDANSSNYKNFANELYIDNVSLKAVLPVSSAKTVARSCRLYPSGDAVSCDYNDASGKELRGWKGFCVEEDPKYQSADPTKRTCLNWWPVDILTGETDIFGQNKLAGYLGRKPLYYCIEAAGNYPYKRILESGETKLLWNTNTILGGVPVMVFSKSSNGFVINKVPSNISGLHLEDIERIVLEPACQEDEKNCFSKNANANNYITLDRSNNWVGYMCNGGLCRSDFDWDTDIKINVSNDNSCGKMAFDLFATRLNFNNGELESTESGLCNTGSEGGYVRYRMVVYLREMCNVIAEVVTPDGENTAWAGKVVSGGWTKNNVDNLLGYIYKTDYEPYGAVVAGKDITDPNKWDSPLYVMPAETSMTFSAPYQVRAGSPYSVAGEAQKFCSSPVLTGKPCAIDDDCDYFTMAGMTSVKKEGKCETNANSLKIGQAQCISGSADNLGKACSLSSDCGFAYDSSGNSGLCMGVNLDKQAMDNIYGGYEKGQENLQNLFAKSYRIWKWSANLGYEEVSGNVSQKFGWDITTESDQNNRPSIKNVMVNGRVGDVNIKNLEKIRLQFNAVINMQQLPLTAFRVDWGDSSPISQVNNLRIDPSNVATTLFHSYSCSNSAGCSFTPKIQIQDNWGWCNNGKASDKCPDDSASTPWQAFGGKVIAE